MEGSHYIAIIIVIVIIIVACATYWFAYRKGSAVKPTDAETFDARANLCSRTDGASLCSITSGITADDIAHDRCIKNPFCGPYVAGEIYAPAAGEYPIDIPITGSLPDHAPPE